MITKTLKNIQKCSGCMACANICPKDAIKFQPDDLGFLYPTINEELCIDCGKCDNVCIAQDFAEIEFRKVRDAYAAQNINDAVLKESSSGGVFSALSDYVLERSGVVVGCAQNEDFSVYHTIVSTKEELRMLRGSKYVQSNIGYIYREILSHLKKGTLVLFTGTPCQVAGLYSIAGRKYDNLITADIICHGVPSQKMYHQYIDYLQNKYNRKVDSFYFRPKDKGWGTYVTKFIHANSTFYITRTGSYYYKNFVGGNMIRESCTSCKFSCPDRIGDFTLGDFWGFQNFKLDGFKNVRKGLSLFTVNTEKAEILTQSLPSKLQFLNVEYSSVLKYNKALYSPQERGEFYQYFIKCTREDKMSDFQSKWKIINKNIILKEKLLYIILPNWFFNLIFKRRYMKSCQW